jgi:hypothetical protein
MANPEWLERFSAEVTRQVDPLVADTILAGAGAFAKLNDTDRARWCVEAMSRLDETVPDQDTKITIMTACSCQCYAGHIEAFRKVWQETQDLDRLIDTMHGTVFYHKPEHRGKAIIITKAPKFPDEYAAATSPEEKRRAFCHCDNMRELTGSISPTYCLCGAGWCKRIWEETLGHPVRVEITQSVLQGDDVCQFAVYVD